MSATAGHRALCDQDLPGGRAIRQSRGQVHLVARAPCSRCGPREPMSPTVTHPVAIPIPILNASWYLAEPPILQIGHPFAHLEGHPHGPLGVIVLRDRVAEEHHHRVADVLVQRPAVPEHDVGHLREVVVERVDSSSGSICSAADVNPRTSEKNVVRNFRLGSSGHVTLAGDDRLGQLRERGSALGAWARSSSATFVSTISWRLAFSDSRSVYSVESCSVVRLRLLREAPELVAVGDLDPGRRSRRPRSRRGRCRRGGPDGSGTRRGRPRAAERREQAQRRERRHRDGQEAAVRDLNAAVSATTRSLRVRDQAVEGVLERCEIGCSLREVQRPERARCRPRRRAR